MYDDGDVYLEGINDQRELQRVVLYGGPCVRGGSRGRGWEEQRCRRVRLPAA